MQLFARNGEGQLISANRANKQENFYCMECQGAVRRRGGPHRQPHFFHLRAAPSCFLSGKSMVHLQIQQRIQQMLPEGETSLEHRFSSIGRIADLVWFSEKLIYEVQCSSISRNEVEERIRDYGTLGFTIVWVLHDRLFNRKNLTESEQFLMNCCHYFSDIDKEGHGKIYDQFEWRKGARRLVKLAPLTVALSEPRRSGRLYFSGDLHDIQLKGEPKYYLDQISKIRNRYAISLWEQLLLKTVVRPYRILLQILLEWACK